MRNTLSTLVACVLLLAVSAGPAGCSGLSKPYPAKQLYSIDIGTPKPAAPTSPGTTLRVLRVRIADPYSHREFQYLIAPNQFQQDYYATFVADPDRLLTTDLIEWMSAAGLHSAVIDASSSVRAERSLQCVVSELYGDLSDPASPKAVVAARFFLLDETDVDAKVLFTRDYRQVEPASGGGADKLTEAWGRGTRKMVEQLTDDLRTAAAAGTPQEIHPPAAPPGRLGTIVP